jgi:ankyrin
MHLIFKCDIFPVLQVLEGKPQYIEFSGNLVPVTKSGDQLQLGFRAFRENRLPFTVRVKDPHADTVGRILFMKEPKVSSIRKTCRHYKISHFM